jgi:predicted NBD/HSP70 family sugar kinase
VSNLIYILNPEMVILSGDMFDHSPKFCAAVEAYTLEKLFDPAAQRAVFRYRKSGDRVYRIGAASLVYQDFFS